MYIVQLKMYIVNLVHDIARKEKDRISSLCLDIHKSICYFEFEFLLKQQFTQKNSNFINDLRDRNMVFDMSERVHKASL